MDREREQQRGEKDGKWREGDRERGRRRKGEGSIYKYARVTPKKDGHLLFLTNIKNFGGGVAAIAQQDAAIGNILSRR